MGWWSHQQTKDAVRADIGWFLSSACYSKIQTQQISDSLLRLWVLHKVFCNHFCDCIHERCSRYLNFDGAPDLTFCPDFFDFLAAIHLKGRIFDRDCKRSGGPGVHPAFTLLHQLGDWRYCKVQCGNFADMCCITSNSDLRESASKKCHFKS